MIIQAKTQKFLLLLALFLTTLLSPFTTTAIHKPVCGIASCNCYLNGKTIGFADVDCRARDYPWSDADCRILHHHDIADACNGKYDRCKGRCHGSYDRCSHCEHHCDYAHYKECLNTNCSDCMDDPAGCLPCFIMCNRISGGDCH